MRAVLALGAWLLVVQGLGAQPPDRRGLLDGPLAPGEVEQLFDAFQLVRAQEMLELTDEQYPEFVARLTALQTARREAQRARGRQLRELTRLSNDPAADVTDLEAQLGAFTRQQREHFEAQAAAVAAIDAVLDPRQRARFRVFEQAMERRRVELLMRARRPGARRGRDAPPRP